MPFANFLPSAGKIPNSIGLSLSCGGFRATLSPWRNPKIGRIWHSAKAHNCVVGLGRHDSLTCPVQIVGQFVWTSGGSDSAIFHPDSVHFTKTEQIHLAFIILDKVHYNVEPSERSFSAISMICVPARRFFVLFL